MKGLFKFILLLASISLVLTSCSSNTRNENTVGGAATGGILGGLGGSLIGGGTGQAVAIGVGIVGGALLGGWIGHNMDSSDNTKMNKAMHNRTRKSTSWKNKKTGTKYTLIPTSNMMTINGNPSCRTYQSTVMIPGKKTQTVNGTACLQSNGTWQTIKA